MKIFVRTFTAVALCLAVMLAGVAMALVHGQMRDVAGSIVICSGNGVVSIPVDAGGNPAGHAHSCDDCALCALVSDDPGGTPSVPGLVEYQLSFVMEGTTWRGLSVREARVRDPPSA